MLGFLTVQCFNECIIEILFSKCDIFILHNLDAIRSNHIPLEFPKTGVHAHHVLYSSNYPFSHQYMCNRQCGVDVYKPMPLLFWLFSGRNDRFHLSEN